jgi:hypothetical protein
MAGPSYVCMKIRYAGGAGSSGCAEASSAIDGRHPMLDVTTVGPNATRVTALVPDGIDQLVLTPDGQGALTLAVTNNVASATMNAANGTVTWAAPDGTNESLRLLAER